ncbi:troponin C-like [Ruditapes philippinarum]|uniref:troponin C-like n=1 Tax=Ruditapes philippinarum TaxID=129788 RepID=UPI00295BD2DC|nr:troponin C-like [Ruditapes philippinarum]
MAELTEEEETHLREVYDELSGEETGGLKIDKLLEMAQIFGLNLSRKEVQDKLDEFDSDQDGDLDFEELKRLVAGLYRNREERHEDIMNAVKTILQNLELNDDDCLTKEQFEQFLMERGDDPLSPEDLTEIFTSLDKDGDAVISAEEIASLFVE